MASLTEYDLILPKVPSEDDWRKEIEQLEGLNREAAIVRANGYSLLKKIGETKVTHERLGWLNSWAKALAAIDSAECAFNSKSGLVLEMLYRSTFECQLHSEVIIEYTLYEQVVERLRAYAAWCLWSDKVYYEELINWKTLAGMWDAKPAREIMEDATQLEMYETIFGPLNMEIDEGKLRKSKLEMKRKYKEKIERINQWLSDPHLTEWASKIEQLDRETKGHVSFFSIFNHDYGSIPKQLQKQKRRFSYFTHLKGSMIMHGSTMEQYILI